MKVEQFFVCHHVSEERKVPLTTLNFKNMLGLGGHKRKLILELAENQKYLIGMN